MLWFKSFLVSLFSFSPSPVIDKDGVFSVQANLSRLRAELTLQANKRYGLKSIITFLSTYEYACMCNNTCTQSQYPRHPSSTADSAPVPPPHVDRGVRARLHQAPSSTSMEAQEEDAPQTTNQPRATQTGEPSKRNWARLLAPHWKS